MTTSFFKLKNSVFSLFVMTCPPTPHRGHIEEFWIGISKAQNVKNYRFEALKPPKMVLTSPKWPRNIQVTILNPYGNFIFEIQKSKIPVRYRGLSPIPWTPPYKREGWCRCRDKWPHKTVTILKFVCTSTIIASWVKQTYTQVHLR